MHSMRDFIKDMSEEEFETNKKGLIDKRLEKPKKLSSRAGRYWNEIVCHCIVLENIPFKLVCKTSRC